MNVEVGARQLSVHGATTPLLVVTLCGTSRSFGVLKAADLCPARLTAQVSRPMTHERGRTAGRPAGFLKRFLKRQLSLVIALICHVRL